MASTTGNKLNITVWGESHSPEIGITIKGLPKNLTIDMEEVQRFLDRRKGGQNAYSTKRAEADTPFIQSGMTGLDNEGGRRAVTTGEDVTALFYNSNVRKGDYDEMKYIPRPSHADYTSYAKYGDEKDRSGGGMFSGRLTLPLCFAGAVCMQYLRTFGIDIFAHVASIGNIQDETFELTNPVKGSIGKDFPVLNADTGAKMVEFMTACANEGDSVGGTIECAVTGLPAGIGEPLYDSMESVISHMIFGVPAVKGIEFGSGFKVSTMKGSECNDPFIIKDGKVATETNNSGGIQGGITNGMPVIFRVALKPTPSIYKEQRTVNMKELTETTLSLKGRHDPCIVPRAVPCIEAVSAIAITDLFLQSGLAVSKEEKIAGGGIGSLRVEIDALDEKIAALMARRMEAASRIAMEKSKSGLPIKNPEREQIVLTHVADVAGGEKGEYVKEVYKKLIEETTIYEEAIWEKKKLC